MRFMTKSGKIFAKIIISILFLILMDSFFCSPYVFGASNILNKSYNVNNYDMDIVIHKNHTYVVNQVIDVDLPNDIDKLTLRLPSGNFSISGLTLNDKDYVLRKDGNQNLLDIIDENHLTKGEHKYTISYEVVELLEKDPSKDLFYFSPLPTTWDRPIENLKIKILFPADFKWDNLKYFAEELGVFDDGKQIKYSRNENTLNLSGKRINPNFSITLKAELPDGYWVNPQNNDWTARFISIFFLLIFTFILIMWLIGGKDFKVKSEQIKEPISGIYPSEIGYILNGHTTIRDIIALIIYFAQKGYLKITENEPKKYIIEKIKSQIEEPKYIRAVYENIFYDGNMDIFIDTKDIGRTLRHVYQATKENIISGFSDENLSHQTKSSRIFRWMSIILFSLSTALVSIMGDLHLYEPISYERAIIFIAISIGLLHLICKRYDSRHEEKQKILAIHFWLLGIILSLFLIIVASFGAGRNEAGYLFLVILLFLCIETIFIVLMNKRAAGNVKLAAYIKSFKHFIAESTPEELREMTDVNEQYFYEALPYVYQFKMLDNWGKKHLWVKVPSQNWFVQDEKLKLLFGNISVDTPYSLVKRIDEFTGTLENEYYKEVGHKKGIFE